MWWSAHRLILEVETGKFLDLFKVQFVPLA